MRKALLLSVAAIGLGAASAALANDDAVSVTVSLADLDLAKPADAARLRARLGRAAITACIAPGTQGVRAREAFGACKSAAFGAANRKAERAIAVANMAGGMQVKTARR